MLKDNEKVVYCTCTSKKIFFCLVKIHFSCEGPAHLYSGVFENPYFRVRAAQPHGIIHLLVRSG